MDLTRRRFTKLVSAGIGLVAQETLLPFNLTSAAMPSAGKLRVGVIGAGGRGKWIIKVIKSIPNVKIAACCDILPLHLEEGLSLADKTATGYSDYRALLDDKSIEAVIITTPLFLHFRMAIDALDAGKHVYCEKTMTYNIEEAIRLREKVASSGIVFQVGYQHRYNPLYTEIKMLVREGYCGKIAKIYATWNRNGDWRRPLPVKKAGPIPGYPDIEHLVNWRMYRAYSGGLMAELCSHQIDVVNWMLEDTPKKILGIGGIDYWRDGRETFDNVNTIFEYPKGIKASFNALTSNALLGYSIRILGDKGSIEIEGEQGHRAKIYAEDFDADTTIDGITGATKIAWGNHEGIPVRVKQPAVDDVLPTENAIKHFADCIEKNIQPFTNAEVGYQAAIAVHMANESMHQETIKYWDYN